ncbi:hypothetical protein PABG_04176 [Paracoccidioides brasiliensis Pb03]|uniref:Mitochondrial thiamine pyrophosphate carrier 1 n=2 Tax=Paracoccidioides brasiliensis TaxID=121759 RepID=C1GC20_PARBD|nr:uncharacterized protein PADG_04542 [Paracoccidioides brasiliensis Pb18]EEH21965.2 hypothetical protein PABG_04176 [Paracoccidioides brasiliensis Pb03]EEH48463.2 hypothetical protein PADG_04542 [Paracoccidioides brasiliensis Pb18]ODH25668.1 hypothetical protein ACO22_05158 [Paracoccidioides brasiliensis]ODH50024.1 hypothetical protein GX48_03829 [Paracoccidioides brasiliensis]
MPSLHQQEHQSNHNAAVNRTTASPSPTPSSSSASSLSSSLSSSSSSCSSSPSHPPAIVPISVQVPSTATAPSASVASTPCWAMDVAKRNKILKDYRTQAASATSTILATLSVTPLENLKTRMQTHDFKNLTHCAKYIWRTEGLRGYTAGALPPLATVTIVRVTNFTVYQNIKHAISKIFERITGESPLATYNTPGSLPTFASVTCFTVSGMVGGLAATPIACPFELCKNVVQTSVLMSNRSLATAATGHPSLHNMPRIGTIDAFKQIVARHGYLGLYTGVRLHAIRDTIGTGLYFGIYETSKQLISTYLGEHTSPFGAPMVAGALSGVIPWCCTYTLDTKKTRAQSILLGKTKEIGEATMAVARSSMYKGISVSIARTALQNMILLTTFEYLKVKINQLKE